MKKLILTVALIGISYFSEAQVWVDSYTKSNGTVVQGHYRSEPNNTKVDNWSTYPNINPYTGETGTKKLDNYYTPTYTYPTTTTPKKTKQDNYIFEPIKF